MKLKVKFTKKFANKKKGDEAEYDSQLASQLVRNDKVAKFVEIKPEKEVKK